MKSFPRVIIAAVSSGSGKTTVTAGIIAALKNRGLKVQPYKIGPDYIDPGFHEIASGVPVHNLDAFLVGKENIEKIFTSTFGDADIAIIEGVMGLYDGGRGGISSTAEISKILNAPVILIIDAKSMGTSAAAIALGFREFDGEVNFAGVILNRVGSESHAKMIFDALEKLEIKCFGAVKRNPEFTMPERHLGLVPTAENNFKEIIEKISVGISSELNLDEILKIANSAKPLNFEKNISVKKNPVAKIGIAHDEAFNFYYPESLKELENFGAELIFFSPLNDEDLPPVDGLIFGGGFPEMFAERLERNKKIRRAVFDAANSGMPIFAECGGFMYLTESLKNFEGKIFEMCGVIPGSAEMTEKLQTVGYIEANLIRDCVIGKTGDKIRAHEFHFSEKIGGSGKEIFDCTKIRTGKKYLAGFSEKNVVASYLHIHFSGCTFAAKNFVEACKKFSKDCNIL